MRIPACGATWQDRAANKLTSCNFEVFTTRVDDIQEEFGGSARKQTKVDTLAEGFRQVHNAQAAAGLLGKKFVISRSGASLHLTTLPTSVLKTMPLPQEYEAELSGAAPNSPAPGSSGAFDAFANSQGSITFNGSENENKRIAMAAKLMFLSLGASLEVIYPDPAGDLLVVQVIDHKKKPEAFMSMIDGVFNGGDHPEDKDRYEISFGLLKDIK